MVWMLAAASLALAQEPATEAPNGAPTEAAADAPTGPAEAPMYLARGASSVRFLGEAFPGPAFEAGEQVTVLLRDGGKVRVFAEERFGWVDSDALTAEAPTPAAPPPGLTLPPGGASSLLGELPPLLAEPPAGAAPAPAPDPQPK